MRWFRLAIIMNQFGSLVITHDDTIVTIQPGAAEEKLRRVFCYRVGTYLMSSSVDSESLASLCMLHRSFRNHQCQINSVLDTE